MIHKLAAMAATVAVAGALSLGAPAALATPAPAHAVRSSVGQHREWVAGQVRALLKSNPGAVQISPNAVRFKGAVLGVTALGRSRSARPHSVSGVCPGNYLCLFWDINFDIGDPSTHFYWIKFYNCGVNYNLYNYRINTGLTWADQASSIDYPGSANGHEAKFNHDGNWWLGLYRDHYLANLTLDGGPSPRGNSNDWITGLYAC
jgi:hypothetical protein